MDNRIVLTTIGIFIGYLTFFATNKGKGKKPRYGIIIQIYMRNAKCIHIHHWILLTFLLLCTSLFVLIMKLPISNIMSFVIGFMIGGIIQGLTYTDRFDIYTTCTEQFLNNKSQCN